MNRAERLFFFYLDQMPEEERLYIRSQMLHGHPVLSKAIFAMAVWHCAVKMADKDGRTPPASIYRAYWRVNEVRPCP